MLIVFDIGNTNIVMGCFEGDKLTAEFRLKTEQGRTIDEYKALLISLLDHHFKRPWKFSRCVVSSVVPPVTQDLLQVIADLLELEALVVGPGIKTGLPIRLAEPGAVGADRVVNAVAAKELFGCPAIVVDFGTATSLDFVSQSGSYEGGIIAAGLTIALESLVRNTAKLPRIELAWPKSVIGKGTVGAMQSGALVGYVCMVDGLIDRIVEEVGEVKHVVATGGLGAIVSQHSQRISCFDPHLTLKGLRIIAQLNS